MTSDVQDTIAREAVDAIAQASISDPSSNLRPPARQLLRKGAFLHVAPGTPHSAVVDYTTLFHTCSNLTSPKFYLQTASEPGTVRAFLKMVEDLPSPHWSMWALVIKAMGKWKAGTRFVPEPLRLHSSSRQLSLALLTNADLLCSWCQSHIGHSDIASQDSG